MLARKLKMKYGIEKAQAQALVAAGFDHPVKIKNATQKALEAVPGIGKATAQMLRAKHGK